MTVKQNLIEKIVQKYTLDLPEGAKVKSGDFISISPEHVMTHDNTGAVMKKFKEIGAPKFFDPKQPIFALDHDVQNKSEKNLQKYKNIEEFAAKYGVDFYPAGHGIGHQIVVEQGYTFPYTMTVASDSHSNTYGGIGALGTPIVRTDAASIWSTGRTWWQVPPVAKVEFKGKLQPGVTGKDVIIALCGLFNHDEVLNCALEFTGNVEQFSISERLTIANMTTEWGCLAGVFPVDQVTIDFYRERAEKLLKAGIAKHGAKYEHPRITNKRIDDMINNPVVADEGADYVKHIIVDLNSIIPHVSGPNSVKVSTSIPQIEKEKVAINKAYLVGCVNSRVKDLHEAAEIVKGHKVKEGVEFYIAAASLEVQKEAEENGDWNTLIEAGAIPLPAGCGQCIGLGTGLLKDNEVGISATNRNFKGRMGSPLAKAYLGSPLVVAASAIMGYICGPNAINGTTVEDMPPVAELITPKIEKAAAAAPGKALDGFKSTLEGELVFCDADNLNTDGIYPGKYTYQDDIPRETMAKVVMENYDPEFAGQVQKNDVVVGGFNFGTGSSREQAATALLYAGIPLVFSGSFSETYKRNAINNGLLVLETPELVQDLRKAFPEKVLTRRTGWKVKIDLIKGEMVVENGKTYTIPTVGTAAQEIIIAGGLENWVKSRI